MSLPVFNIKSFKIDLKFKIKNLKLTKGFTLIELLVVISIIAILMAVATVSFLNAQQKGRDNKRKSDLKGVQQALELYYNQNGKYPYNDANKIACTSTSSGINWGVIFSCSSPTATYMNPLPKDPIFTTTTTPATPYYYWSDNTATPPNQNYKIFAKIENTKDTDLLNNNPTTCSSNAPTDTNYKTSTINFCVVNP